MSTTDHNSRSRFSRSGGAFGGAGCVRQARQLKVYWGRSAGLLPPRPLHGGPGRSTESVNCPPPVILVYSHHPQPLTDNTVNKADDITKDHLGCNFPKFGIS